MLKEKWREDKPINLIENIERLEQQIKELRYQQWNINTKRLFDIENITHLSAIINQINRLEYLLNKKINQYNQQDNQLEQLDLIPLIRNQSIRKLLRRKTLITPLKSKDKEERPNGQSLSKRKRPSSILEPDDVIPIPHPKKESA